MHGPVNPAHATQVALLREELAYWLAERGADEPPTEEERDGTIEEAYRNA